MIFLMPQIDKETDKTVSQLGQIDSYHNINAAKVFGCSHVFVNFFNYTFHQFRYVFVFCCFC